MKLSTAFATILPLIPITVAQTNARDSSFLGASPSERRVVNDTQARLVLEASAREATSLGVPYNIAVTDPSGLLVSFLRMDSAFPGATEIAMKKARTVSLFNGIYTTAQLYNLTQPAGMAYGVENTNGGLITFGGGVPLIVSENDREVFIGALGVSGGTTDIDAKVAEAGVQAIGGYIVHE